ncbi:MAG TPA: hypothetical protein VGM98_16740 [Schlesneria sp.]|jgi:hypothetical protein
MNRSHVDAAIRIRLCAAVAIFLACSSAGSAQTSTEKHPVPAAARQTEIKKLLDETYELRKATSQAKKEEAIATLMEAAEGGELSQDETYVVLIVVLNLTKDAGKFESFMDAVGLLAKTYEGNPSQITEKYLSEFLRDCKNNESLKSANRRGTGGCSRGRSGKSACGRDSIAWRDRIGESTPARQRRDQADDHGST